MMPFTFSLRQACRGMLLVWLVLLVGMSGVLAKATRTPISGNLLAFLLSSSPQPSPVLPVTPPLPAPTPLPAEQPAPPPVLEPVPALKSEWTPMPRGKKPGSGVLEGPEIIQLPDGGVQVLFTYAGEKNQPGDPGSVTAGTYTAHATSVDLHGPWKRVRYINKTMPANSALSRVQVAEHKGYVRVSATSRGAAPQELTEYTAGKIRITFTVAQPSGQPSAGKAR